MKLNEALGRLSGGTNSDRIRRAGGPAVLRSVTPEDQAISAYVLEDGTKFTASGDDHAATDWEVVTGRTDVGRTDGRTDVSRTDPVHTDPRSRVHAENDRTDPEHTVPSRSNPPFRNK